MSNKEIKEGQRQLELLALEEQQRKEKKDAERFTKAHQMSAKEAKEHMEMVEERHDRQKEEMVTRHEAQRKYKSL